MRLNMPGAINSLKPSIFNILEIKSAYLKFLLEYNKYVI